MSLPQEIRDCITPVSLKTNRFGDRYIFQLNRNIFDNTGADSIFQRQYKAELFEADTFYIIAGTDSGLLVDYIQKIGAPRGSRYLFIELPDIINVLTFESIQNNSAIVVCEFDQIKENLKRMHGIEYAQLGKLKLHTSLAVSHGFYKAYTPFFRAIKEHIYQYRWQASVALCNRTFKMAQIKNLTENQIPASILKGLFNGKTAVLLGGGPSLDNNLAWITDNRKNLIVAAVSRIAKRLIAANIIPDIIVSVDPQELNLIYSKDILVFQNDSLLVNSSFLSSELLSLWGGRKVYLGQQLPWKSPTSTDNDNIPPHPPTVTNSAHWLLVEMGCRQIILMGVDFCFSAEGFTHSLNSPERNAGITANKGDQIVETYSGLLVETTNEYLLAANNMNHNSYKGKERDCITINSSPSALKLENVEYVPVFDLKIEPLPQSAKETLQERISLPDQKQKVDFYVTIRQQIQDALLLLPKISKLASTAIQLNKQMFNKDHSNISFKHKKKLDKIEETLNTKYHDLTEFVKNFGITHFISIVKAATNNELTNFEVFELGEKFYKAYLASIDEIRITLEQADNRISSRIKEENDNVDITLLLKQWENDRQFGRAKLWRDTHLNIHKVITKSAATEYDDIFKKHDIYIQQLKNKLDKNIDRRLNDIIGLHYKAICYFDDKNYGGLNQLVQSMKNYGDKNKCFSLIKLSEGFLAELDGCFQDAIKSYEEVNDNTIRFEALKRLLSIHADSNNHEGTLQTLAELAEMTHTYVPLLADMLSFLGDKEKSIELYTDYMLLIPNDLHAMFKLGKIYDSLDYTEGLEWTMQYILDKDPTNAAAQTLLNISQKKTGS